MVFNPALQLAFLKEAIREEHQRLSQGGKKPHGYAAAVASRFNAKFSQAEPLLPGAVNNLTLWPSGWKGWLHVACVACCCEMCVHACCYRMGCELVLACEA